MSDNSAAPPAGVDPAEYAEIQATIKNSPPANQAYLQTMLAEAARRKAAETAAGTAGALPAQSKPSAAMMPPAPTPHIREGQTPSQVAAQEAAPAAYTAAKPTTPTAPAAAAEVAAPPATVAPPAVEPTTPVSAPAPTPPPTTGEVALALANAPVTDQPSTTQSPDNQSPDNQSPPPADDTKVERDWREDLKHSITGLQAALQAKGIDPETRFRMETQLRMLELVAGRREAAFRPIAAIPTAEQEYWTQQLYGIDTLLSPKSSPVPEHRASKALLHLREAVDHLAGQSSLEVRNLAFCTQVFSFGLYEKFEDYQFRSNQPVLLYMEVDNFVAKQGQHGAGYETALQGGYQIFDAQGRRVADYQFDVAKETCANRRRDFFIRYPLHIPKDIPHGKYTLKLTMEDLYANKFGQSAISFSIVE